jgi:hypothetical protein
MACFHKVLEHLVYSLSRVIHCVQAHLCSFPNNPTSERKGKAKLAKATKKYLHVYLLLEMQREKPGITCCNVERERERERERE